MKIKSWNTNLDFFFLIYFKYLQWASDMPVHEALTIGYNL